MNEENKEITRDELQADFEESLSKKDKLIKKLEQEKYSALQANSKLVTKLDDEIQGKKDALAKAERYEARYLQNNEIKSRSEQQEKDLLNTVLSNQKRVAREYTTACLEASCAKVRQIIQSLCDYQPLNVP